MSARVDVDDIQTTRSEQLLAVVLGIFLLIGGIWVYAKIDDAVRTTQPPDYAYRGTPADKAAVARLGAADRRLGAAQLALRSARDNLELRRETYRTALEEGGRDPGLRDAYVRAQTRFSRAQQNVRTARRELGAAQPAAQAAQDHISKVQNGRVEKRELLAFVFRLVWVIANLAFAYWLLAWLRRRRSRYYPVGFAFVGYAAVLTFVMATDYLTDYFDPLELGPLVLSIVGIALTLLAFVALQRYLAKRLPQRRVRKGDCPFCGYPVRAGMHCEGCGRDVRAACAQCGEPRRVATRFCAVCGAA
jgi:hypothetical protein